MTRQPWTSRPIETLPPLLDDDRWLDSCPPPLAEQVAAAVRECVGTERLLAAIAALNDEDQDEGDGS